jgi:hypothetical protein
MIMVKKIKNLGIGRMSLSKINERSVFLMILEYRGKEIIVKIRKRGVEMN